MEEVRVESWEAFEIKLDALRADSKRPRYLLFRGQADSSWQLRTTLERSTNFNRDILAYYSIVSEIQPQIETFTGFQWGVDERGQKIFEERPYIHRDSESVNIALASGGLPAYAYLVYLRHHGFPSPLLDWTGSPYVAAYFAFHTPLPADRAIYVYAEMDAGAKSRSSKQPEIYSFGPNIKAIDDTFSNSPSTRFASSYPMTCKPRKKSGSSRRMMTFLLGIRRGKTSSRSS